MTNEEAAKKIEQHILIHHLNEDSQVVKAMRLAIKTLKERIVEQTKSQEE